MPTPSIATSHFQPGSPGRRALRAKERRRARLLAVPVVAATLGLIVAATLGAAAVTGAVDDGESTVPVVSSKEAESVTYTVSGSVPEQLIGARDVPVVQHSATGAGASGTVAPGVQWPVDMRLVRVSDGFGPRNSPCSGCSSNHRGLDLAGPQGTRVGSIANGIVIASVPTDGAGLGAHVVVQHRIDGLQVRSVYGHLVAGSPAVKVGDEVKTGQLVGLLGNTGASTGPHLHLETIVDGTHVDPQKFLKKYADGAAIDIFGDAPTMPPPSGNPAENDGYTLPPGTQVPPTNQIPETQVTPPSPAGSTSPTNQPSSPETTTPTPPASETPPPSVSPTPSGEPETPSPAPSPSQDPTPPVSPEESTSESAAPTPAS